MYQIASTRTVNTQHGQSVVLSLQKADRFCCSVWACGIQARNPPLAGGGGGGGLRSHPLQNRASGILTIELLQNPTMMVTSRLFIRPTGSKTSKFGRVYNSYQHRLLNNRTGKVKSWEKLTWAIVEF